MLHTGTSSLQGDTTNEEDDEHDIGKQGSEVNGLEKKQFYEIKY